MLLYNSKFIYISRYSQKNLIYISIGVLLAVPTKLVVSTAHVNSIV